MSVYLANENPRTRSLLLQIGLFFPDLNNYFIFVAKFKAVNFSRSSPATAKMMAKRGLQRRVANLGFPTFPRSTRLNLFFFAHFILKFENSLRLTRLLLVGLG